MRVAVFSDIHNEMHRIHGGASAEFGPQRRFWTPPPNLDADWILLAGDIATTPDDLRDVIDLMEREQPRAEGIAVIAGNHEYHRDRKSVALGAPATGAPFGEEGIRRYREALDGTRKSVFLEKETLQLGGGWTLAAATLWTDLSNPLSEANALMYANDYKEMEGPGGDPVAPRHTTDDHRRAKEFFAEAMDSYDNEKTIVMTHHSPVLHGMEARDKGPLAELYGGRLDNLIGMWQPALWIHGHTHRSLDRMLGETRAIDNPRGYWPAGLNDGFEAALVIEAGRERDRERSASR